ncbi:TetR/AcrR family transcriptional regulator [Streptomyces sp. ODS28]|uniref:TetR/AcrR family transcriptional regulator n=1 Tax=Streptomyces sp. ODS28 TaxID=3136688 RepID=UPI0031ED806B
MTSTSAPVPAPASAREGARRTRLTPERERELYGAVLDLVREVGYEAMTMDAVASRSKCSKATLYRQWQGKPRLVSAAMRHCKPFSLDGLDTGSLRGDLYELARRIGGAKKDIDLMRGVVLAIRKDADLAAAMHEAIIQPETEAMRGMVERAVERGEVADDHPSIPFFPHMINGACFSRPMLEQREADTEYLKRYVDTVVLPLFMPEQRGMPE